MSDSINSSEQGISIATRKNLSPDELITSGTHHLKQNATELIAKTEGNYLHALANNLRSVSNRYQTEVSSYFDQGTPASSQYFDIKKHLDSWFKSNAVTSFSSVTQTAEMFKDNLPNNFLRLNALYSNMRHDAVLAITPLQEGLSQESGYENFINKDLAEWPQHVMQRIARQIEKKPEITDIDPRQVNDYLSRLFTVLTNSDPQFNLEFSVDPSITTIKGDQLYFEGALFNLIRNSQNKLSHRADKSTTGKVTVDMKMENGRVILQVRDNAGGFPDDMLQEIPKKDVDGNPISGATIQKALVRGETSGNGGSGLGLDIVRQITEEHLKGNIKINNEIYPGTEQLGAVVEMSFPYKS